LKKINNNKNRNFDERINAIQAHFNHIFEQVSFFFRRLRLNQSISPYFDFDFFFFFMLLNFRVKMKHLDY